MASEETSSEALLRLKEEGCKAIKAAVAPGSVELRFQSGEVAAWLPARTECRGEPRQGVSHAQAPEGINVGSGALFNARLSVAGQQQQ
ncbi:hypothetical protein NDU88_006793 [Pleurodeles waltl]|uniref:Uncharacterized protein n=1 Tax=Pleurodeles waltl TaxID=8319 RepID=A0AAV7LRG4_PLEWA|nr:hypothetical protein NDU88_006793 [Pleurodeles waltl]